MNRRQFLTRLGGLAAAIGLGPYLPELAPAPVVEYAMNTTGLDPDSDAGPYAYHIIGAYNLIAHNPRRLGVISGV